MMYVDEFTARLISRLADEAIWKLTEAHEILGVEYVLFDLKGYHNDVKRGVIRNISVSYGYHAFEYQDGEIIVCLVKEVL